MAIQHKYSRILTQEDFDTLNTQYNLELEFDSASDYRHAQVIWNLHCKVEELDTQLKDTQRAKTVRIGLADPDIHRD
jgi:hypothetical protein